MDPEAVIREPNLNVAEAPITAVRGAAIKPPGATQSDSST
jgi:hypothetical protein